MMVKEDMFLVNTFKMELFKRIKNIVKLSLVDIDNDGIPELK